MTAVIKGKQMMSAGVMLDSPLATDGGMAA
jgi:hypothetical protein